MSDNKKKEEDVPAAAHLAALENLHMNGGRLDEAHVAALDFRVQAVEQLTRTLLEGQKRTLERIRELVSCLAEISEESSKE